MEKENSEETILSVLKEIRDSQRSIEAAALWQAPFVNTKQAAVMLDMEPETICEKIRNGIIPGNKPKGFKRYMIATEDLVRLLAQKSKPNQKSIDLQADERVLEILKDIT